MFTAAIKNKSLVNFNIVMLTERVLAPWCEGFDTYYDPGIMETLSSAMSDVPEGRRYIVWTTQDEDKANDFGFLTLFCGIDGQTTKAAEPFIRLVVQEIVSAGYEIDETKLDSGLISVTVNKDSFVEELDTDKSLITTDAAIALPAEYEKLLGDEYGWNEPQDNEYQIPNDENTGHIYLPLQEGESVIEGLLRVKIPFSKVLSYQRCISTGSEIYAVEPWTPWNADHWVIPKGQ